MASNPGKDGFVRQGRLGRKSLCHKELRADQDGFVSSFFILQTESCGAADRSPGNSLGQVFVFRSSRKERAGRSGRRTRWGERQLGAERLSMETAAVR
jgi:hypothetical protein